MQKLSKNDRNKYIITLHDDVITAISELTVRAQRLKLAYLLNLDGFINGAVLEHLAVIDAQLKDAEKKQYYKNCENYLKYGTIDEKEIEKIKRGLKENE